MAAFGRCVGIEEGDAEGWSNLAAALLRLEPGESATDEGAEEVDVALDDDDDEEEEEEEEEHTLTSKTRKMVVDPQRHRLEALVALKRAAALKRDSFRIWQNLLTVAASISPPPYADIIVAQQRLIELRGHVDGEACIDVEIVEGLVAHVIAMGADDGKEKATGKKEEAAWKMAGSKKTPLVGLEKMVVDLVQRDITPLITTSRRLWLVVAKLALHLKHPGAALEAYEKAWRVTVNRPGWEEGRGSAAAEEAWMEVVDATVEVVDGYESLGGRRREDADGNRGGNGGGGGGKGEVVDAEGKGKGEGEGVAEGMEEGELVCRDWKFKARSAIRGVLGRAREGWEGSEGWERLRGRMGELGRG